MVILSGGFREVIAPVAELLGVSPDRVLCNDLIYDADGRVTGVDDANPLSHADGKPAVIHALNLSGRVVMVGDGWNDARRSSWQEGPTPSTPSPRSRAVRR